MNFAAGGPVNQGATLGGRNTFTSSQVIDVSDDTYAGLRVTQRGTGNVVEFEDSANPDTTAFTINNSGQINTGGVSTTGYSGAPRFRITGTNSGSSTMENMVFTTTATLGPTFVTSRSRGTIGVNTIVQSGDLLGSYSFAGADGTTFIEAARITAEVDGTPGTNDMPGRLVFLTTPDGSATSEEAMRIDNTKLVSLAKDRAIRFNNQTSAAAAQTGTLTNAPAAGNPTFWLKVNIGGTNYAIPCWAG